MTTPFLFVPTFSWPAAPGGKLYAYAAGGTTPQATYSDAAGAVPNTNPVILDVNGTATVRLGSGGYHFVLKDSTGTTTLWDQDNYQSSFLVASDIGALLYPQTTAETAASVTPTSYVYPEGNAFRYMTSAQISDVIAGNLTQDVTTALRTAISIGVPVYLPDGYYLVTGSLNPSAVKQFVLFGNPYRSQIINKAAANTPTLVLTDCLYFNVSGIVLGGRAGFPNKAVLFNTAGGTHSGFGVFNDVVLQPNGIGIELQKCNTIQFNRVHYWPSNGIGGISNTSDASTRKFAVFCDGTIAGNFANEVTFNGCNMTGVDSSISGYASFSISAPAINGIQVVNLFDCEVEGTPLIFANIQNLNILDCYVDRSVFTFTGCRSGGMKSCYDPKTVTITGCLNFILDSISNGGGGGDTVTIDNTSSQCGVVNCNLIGYTDSGANSIRLNSNNAGTVLADKLTINQWTSPSFSAGSYTASGSMTWTVASGNVATYEYTQNGKSITVNWFITGSTAGGVADKGLQIAIPGSFIANKRVRVPCVIENNNVFSSVGIAEVTVGGTFISIFIDAGGATNWTLSANTGTTGSITFEVQ